MHVGKSYLAAKTFTTRRGRHFPGPGELVSASPASGTPQHQTDETALLTNWSDGAAPKRYRNKGTIGPSVVDGRYLVFSYAIDTPPEGIVSILCSYYHKL